MYAKFMNHKALDSIRYPRQYALLVARGIIIDHLRHSRVVPISSSGDLELLDVPELDANVEERLEFRQEVAAVTAALNEFPKLCREVLILRRIEGLSQKDVARRLGISEKTVEKYMAIGVRLLIDAFGRGGRSRANTTTTRQMGLSTNVNGK
jgi:RNA polymerase sigma-70 factor (ECF subfamily)